MTTEQEAKQMLTDLTQKLLDDLRSQMYENNDLDKKRLNWLRTARNYGKQLEQMSQVVERMREKLDRGLALSGRGRAIGRTNPPCCRHRRGSSPAEVSTFLDRSTSGPRADIAGQPSSDRPRNY